MGKAIKWLLGSNAERGLRHVDGLRTIAILPVILYHFSPSKCPGGFVGVDIFFVISGFLITPRIINDLKADKFSFSDFYMRRIKRIIPVYSVALLVVMVSIPFFYSVGDSKNILTTAQYSLVFSANIYFSNAVSYFGVGSENNPLLHLWSLGVEEQFYLIIPLLLLLINKVDSKNLMKYIYFIFFISLSLCVILLQTGNRDFAFYQLPTRAWELLAGCILSQIPKRKIEAGKRNVLSILGIILIALSFVFINEKLPFPGLLALPPVIGTMLLIRYGEFADIVAFLSTDLFVLVGRISYSLYIWHWPIIVFTRNYSTFVRLSAIVFCFLLSLLSWKYFEEPIRQSKLITTRRAFLGFSTVCLFLFLFATVFQLYPGKNGVFPTVYNGVNLWPVLENRRDAGRSTCSIDDLIAEKPSLLVRIGDKSIKPSFALWGDSTALALLPGVDSISAKNYRSGYYVNLKHGLTLQKDIGGYPFEPRADREPVLRWLEGREDIESVFLVNSWIRKIQNLDDINEIVYICKRLHAAGKRVFFFESNPIPNVKTIRPSDWGIEISDDVANVSIESYASQTKLQSLAVSKIAVDNLADIIESSQAFLVNDHFRMSENGRSYFLDATHVSALGASLIMEYASVRIWGISSQ